MAGSEPGTRFQFERQGYFVVEPDSRPEALVFNRTITLRDTWAKSRAVDSSAKPSRKERAAKAAQVSEGPPIPTLSTEQASEAAQLSGKFGISSDDASVLVSDQWLLDMFRETAALVEPTLAANWVLHEVQRLRKASSGDLKLTPTGLASLIELVASDSISSRIAKDLLAEIADSGADPAVLVSERGLNQIDDAAALEGAAQRVIDANAGKADAYRSGKTGLIGFFMGQVMRETGGKANPEKAREILERLLS